VSYDDGKFLVVKSDESAKFDDLRKSDNELNKIAKRMN
jgi:hypothetical protein